MQDGTHPLDSFDLGNTSVQDCTGPENSEEDRTLYFNDRDAKEVKGIGSGLLQEYFFIQPCYSNGT